MEIYEFKLVKQVDFSEADPAGILHFSNYFRYMELVEHAFYRKLGISGFMQKKKQNYGWPRVHAKMDYLAPLAYEDQVEIHLLVAEKHKKAMDYLFYFRRLPDRKLVAKGHLTVVYVSVDPQTRKLKASKIPDEITRSIVVAPKKLLELEE
ncbi:Acyl-CoA thioesterase [Sulfidibacter corallicola]|uniref:Acyl-CoA thioesterase n=1 Tax=Sulfidibacter corallicola TaxID=2818388 RepID=A0A8A4TI35_SULCO|nr:acyl-CoA thioesterase [Sulfidibacter corallicola]QTD49586.1 acyl-CoA thioesterase [Sulfidibacter corallicola]